MQYIIEARRRGSAGEGQWDSDHVGSESYDKETARSYFDELCLDADFAGFDIRICRRDEELDSEVEIIRKVAGNDELWGLWGDGSWGPSPDDHQ